MMLWFDGDTEARIVDFAKIITKNSALHELKDPKVLKKAKIFGTALRWEDQDLDIEAADLYEVSFPVETKVTAFINKVARYIRPLDGTPSNSSID
jgi:hypothetical protein